MAMNESYGRKNAGNNHYFILTKILGIVPFVYGKFSRYKPPCMYYKQVKPQKGNFFNFIPCYEQNFSCRVVGLRQLATALAC